MIELNDEDASGASEQRDWPPHAPSPHEHGADRVDRAHEDPPPPLAVAVSAERHSASLTRTGHKPPSFCERPRTRDRTRGHAVPGEAGGPPPTRRRGRGRSQ